MRNIGAELKAIRKKVGMTQVRLSQVSGVSQQAISGIEKGGHSPTEATLRLLAQALGVTVSQIVGDDQSRNKDDVLTDVERNLIDGYRRLSEEGKEYIRKQLFVASKLYAKQESMAADMA